MKEKELKKIELQQDRNFFVLSLIVGILLNFIVFSSNNYMMPVKSNSNYSDLTALHGKTKLHEKGG